MSSRARSRRWRLVLVAAVALVGFLYYRPARAYLDTRHALTERRAEVQGLEAQKRLLERRLASTTSPAALELEARKLGLVKPGERLRLSVAHRPRRLERRLVPRP